MGMQNDLTQTDPVATVTDTTRWLAIVNRTAEGLPQFVYAVKTTGIYCRPTCPARRPLRRNVLTFGSALEAEVAGFRACLRCRPQESSPLDESALRVVSATRAAKSETASESAHDLAASVGVSSRQLLRDFRRHLGITPHEYLVALRHNTLRQLLAESEATTSAIFRSGYDSVSQAYDDAPSVLGMTPRAFRDGGDKQRIAYCVGETEFGNLLVAATGRGICWLSLGDDRESLVAELHSAFGRATVKEDDNLQQLVTCVAASVASPPPTPTVPIDVQGTAFQLRVWKTLQAIPQGTTRTYSEVASSIGNPQASRAVAAACAANPLAIVIPCHRVVGKDGELRGYRWGVDRKRKLLSLEKTVEESE